MVVLEADAAGCGDLKLGGLCSNPRAEIEVNCGAAQRYTVSCQHFPKETTHENACRERSAGARGSTTDHRVPKARWKSAGERGTELCTESVGLGQRGIEIRTLQLTLVGADVEDVCAHTHM